MESGGVSFHTLVLLLRGKVCMIVIRLSNSAPLHVENYIHRCGNNELCYLRSESVSTFLVIDLPVWVLSYNN